MGLLIKFKWYSDFGKVTIPVAFESPNLYGRQFPFLVLSFGLPRGIYVSSVYKQFPFLVLKIECGHNWSLFRKKATPNLSTNCRKLPTHLGMWIQLERICYSAYLSLHYLFLGRWTFPLGSRIRLNITTLCQMGGNVKQLGRRQRRLPGL